MAHGIPDTSRITWRAIGPFVAGTVLLEGPKVNKAELIDALAERIGDRKTAGAAVDGLVDIVVRTVDKGDKVTITGFGVFEKRARAARMARNPRTGEAVKVKKTSVPAFRPGTNFKEVVSGAKPAASKPATSRPKTVVTGAGAKAAASVPAKAASRTAAAAKDTAKSAAKKVTKKAGNRKKS